MNSNKTIKTVSVKEPFPYNRIFDPVSGFMARWGATKEDDPLYSPVGPEILDLEISVNGCSMGCPMCYKGNVVPEPVNMTFETFCQILDKMNPNLDSIAFGITDYDTNPDFEKMLRESRRRNIVPNFTLSGKGIDSDDIRRIAPLVGAVAVSVYEHDKWLAYETIDRFLHWGVKQTNIHLFTSEESLDFVYEVLNDIQQEDDLQGLNAVVFLGVKPKGRAKNKFHSLSDGDFADLVDYCTRHKIPYGFDSCSAPKYVRAVKAMEILDEQKDKMVQAAESCESFGMFSAYINVYGDYFPCSFCEDEKGWEEGMNVVECDSFLDDIWFSKRLNQWRKRSLMSKDCNGCRQCLIFEEVN